MICPNYTEEKCAWMEMSKYRGCARPWVRTCPHNPENRERMERFLEALAECRGR